MSEEEINKLTENHQTNQNFRVRHRSHAILLFHQAFSIKAIAKICPVERDTVSVWIDLWDELKFVTKLTESYRDAEYFKRNLRTIGVLIDQQAIKSGVCGSR